jgi:hypothetical protein
MQDFHFLCTAAQEQSNSLQFAIRSSNSEKALCLWQFGQNYGNALLCMKNLGLPELLNGRENLSVVEALPWIEENDLL